MAIFVLGTGLIIVIIAFIFTYTFYRRQAIEEEKNQIVPTTTPADPDALRREAEANKGGTNYSFDPLAETKREYDEDDIKKIAEFFAERFGSYSNQSNYGNIVDLKLFMTEKMQVWADNYVDELKASNNGNAAYYGVTSIAIASKANSFNATSGTAEVLVTTQRQESSVGGENKDPYYQDVLISLTKEGGEWKVDSAFWQK